MKLTLFHIGVAFISGRPQGTELEAKGQISHRQSLLEQATEVGGSPQDEGLELHW